MRTLWNCDGGSCPQLDERSDGDFEILGYTIDPTTKPNTPTGHGWVRIPRATLINMAQTLLRDTA